MLSQNKIQNRDSVLKLKSKTGRIQRDIDINRFVIYIFRRKQSTNQNYGHICICGL